MNESFSLAESWCLPLAAPAGGILCWTRHVGDSHFHHLQDKIKPKQYDSWLPQSAGDGWVSTM